MKYILTTGEFCTIGENKFLAIVEISKDKFFVELDNSLKAYDIKNLVSAFPELKDDVENAELHDGYSFDTSETVKNRFGFEIGTKINIGGDNGIFSLNLLKAEYCPTWTSVSLERLC